VVIDPMVGLVDGGTRSAFRRLMGHL